MAWVLRLVGTESDSVTRGVDLIELHRPSGLVDIANLGLTLPEARQLLARVQQVVVRPSQTWGVMLRADRDDEPTSRRWHDLVRGYRSSPRIEP